MQGEDAGRKPRRRAAPRQKASASAAAAEDAAPSAPSSLSAQSAQSAAPRPQDPVEAAAAAAVAVIAEAEEAESAPLPLPPASKAAAAVAPPVSVDAGGPIGVQLTRYERTQVIGIRAEQLARGALAFVEVPIPDGSANSPHVSMYDIAERELAAGRLPFIVVRHMPDGGTQHLRLCRPTATS